MKNPSVSIIIPCYNEQKYIEKCLDSVLNQTYENILEILVVDGKSEDNTKAIAKKYFGKISVIDNSKRIFASACNIGIKKSKGDVIVILGCHAFYPPDYVKKCVENLIRFNAENSGGRIAPVSEGRGIVSKAIALSLATIWGNGRKKITGIKETDTVFGGCYKKEVFDRIGYFNENLIRSSDIDFNLRLKKAGGKIVGDSNIVAYYYPENDLINYFLHNIKDGTWAIVPFGITKKSLKTRHYIPMIFIFLLPIVIIPYLIVTIYFSLIISIKEKKPSYFFILPIVFVIRHFGYGIGSLIGLIKIIFK